MRKKLIVSGDSCTEDDFQSPCHPETEFNFPKWPNHLADHLGMKLVNKARGGQGNEFVYHSLLEEVTRTPKEEIGLVIAGWSQCHRYDWQTGYMGGPDGMNTWGATRVFPKGDLLHWVTKTLRHYISFQTLCEHKGVPFFHFQTGDLFENYLHGLRPTEREAMQGKSYLTRYPGGAERALDDEKKILERIEMYDHYIKNFIGWPGLTPKYRSYPWKLAKKGGFNIHSTVIGNTREDQLARGFVISKLDDHPNELGHKAMADFFIGQERVWNKDWQWKRKN